MTLAFGVFSIASAGCGCSTPKRALPATSDPQYKKVETMIEHSLYPEIFVFAPTRKRQSLQNRELPVLAALGYFHRSQGFFMPTAYARRISKHDGWPPLLGGPFKFRFNDDDHIGFRIGTYSVLKLNLAAHYDGAPCGAYGGERDVYGFTATLSLNALGRALLAKHLLYTRLNASSPIRRWDGHRAVHDVWSDDPFDERNGYQDVVSAGEHVDLKSSFL